MESDILQSKIGCEQPGYKFLKHGTCLIYEGTNRQQ